jgi:hypothetical protein
LNWWVSSTNNGMADYHTVPSFCCWRTETSTRELSVHFSLPSAFTLNKQTNKQTQTSRSSVAALTSCGYQPEISWRQLADSVGEQKQCLMNNSHISYETTRPINPFKAQWKLCVPPTSIIVGFIWFWL